MCISAHAHSNDWNHSSGLARKHSSYVMPCDRAATRRLWPTVNSCTVNISTEPHLTELSIMGPLQDTSNGCTAEAIGGQSFQR